MSVLNINSKDDKLHVSFSLLVYITSEPLFQENMPHAIC